MHNTERLHLTLGLSLRTTILRNNMSILSRKLFQVFYYYGYVKQIFRSHEGQIINSDNMLVMKIVVIVRRGLLCPREMPFPRASCQRYREGQERG